MNTGNSDAKPSPGNTLRKNKQTIIYLNAGKVGPQKDYSWFPVLFKEEVGLCPAFIIYNDYC